MTSLNPFGGTDPISGILGMSGPDYPSRHVKISDLTKQYSDWDWHTATAIVMVESRGQMGQTHKNTDGSTDYGLMQINNHAWADMGFDFQRMLTDAQYSIWAGHEVWKKAGWGPWGPDFSSGKVHLWMNHDATVNTKPSLSGGVSNGNQDPPAAGNMGDGGNIFGTIGDILKALVDPSTYMRLGKGALGGVLIITGVGAAVFIVANKTPTPVKHVTKTITGS